MGRKIADPKRVTNDEFKTIINGVKNIPIYCGVTEDYASFLCLFQQETGIQLNKKITIRKKTPQEYKIDISDDLRKKIVKSNHYDY